jgi:hypothetical protein
MNFFIHNAPFHAPLLLYDEELMAGYKKIGTHRSSSGVSVEILQFCSRDNPGVEYLLDRRLLRKYLTPEVREKIMSSSESCKRRCRR